MQWTWDAEAKTHYCHHNGQDWHIREVGGRRYGTIWTRWILDVNGSRVASFPTLKAAKEAALKESHSRLK